MARKYARDSRGRFSSTGATARGGRLKTASGKKRETQTMKASTGRAANTLSKPKGLKPFAATDLSVGPKAAAKPAAKASAPKAKPAAKAADKSVMAKPKAKPAKPVETAQSKYKFEQSKKRWKSGAGKFMPASYAPKFTRKRQFA